MLKAKKYFLGTLIGLAVFFGSFAFAGVASANYNNNYNNNYNSNSNYNYNNNSYNNYQHMHKKKIKKYRWMKCYNMRTQRYSWMYRCSCGNSGNSGNYMNWNNYGWNW